MHAHNILLVVNSPGDWGSQASCLHPAGSLGPVVRARTPTRPARAQTCWDLTSVHLNWRQRAPVGRVPDTVFSLGNSSVPSSASVWKHWISSGQVSADSPIFSDSGLQSEAHGTIRQDDLQHGTCTSGVQEEDIFCTINKHNLKIFLNIITFLFLFLFLCSFKMHVIY